MITINYTAGTDRHQFTTTAEKAPAAFRLLERLNHPVTSWHREPGPVVVAAYSRINGEIRSRRFVGLLGVKP